MTENALDTGPHLAEDTRDPRWVMIVTGAIGLVAAIVLTVDKLKLSDDPTKTFSCDVNAFVSCAGVMASPESAVFGFANSYLGVVGFAGVLLFGSWLVAGRQLPPVAWIAVQVGVFFGIGSVTWLQYQSIYDIGKLCPYCMVVWAAMIPLFVTVTARNLRAWLPRSTVTRIVSDWTLLIIILWYVAIAAAIWFKFGSDLWA